MPISHYVGCAAASWVVFLLLVYIAPWLSSVLSLGYRQLSEHEKLSFQSRIISSIHAVIVGLISLYLILYDRQLSDIPGNAGVSPDALYVCAFVLGYMIEDLLQMCWHHVWLGLDLDVPMIVHHLVVISVKSMVIVFHKGAWFTVYRLVSELSTPFVNQRFLLDVIKYDRSSALFLVNGIVMTIVFFLVRVASIPIYYYFVYDVYVSGDRVHLDHMWYLVLYAGIPLDLLNVFWFRKMVKGAIKVLRARVQTKKLLQQKGQ